MTKKPLGKRAPQQAARVGAVSKAFDRHDAEIGKKVSVLLAEWHKRKVWPLEQRIAWLEKPWWIRWWEVACWRAGKVWNRAGKLWQKIRRR